MAQTRIRIAEQLQTSAAAQSILITDSSSKPAYFAPTTGTDKILFYDDSANSWASLSLGTNLAISGTTLNATAGAGGYATIQEEGSTVGGGNTIINFVGAGLTAANAGGGITSITVDATLNALAAYNTNGILVQTAADTFAGRTLTAPAAGFTITDGSGVAGNPTFVLANDLAALEGLASTGIARRTGADTWTVGTTVTVAEGGTGATTLTGLLQGNGTSAVTAITNSSTVGQILRVTGASSYAWGALDLSDTDAVVNALPAINGGTGQTVYTVGDILSANTTTTLSKVAAVATGSVLKSAGVSTLPVWGTLASTDLSNSSNIALLNATQTFSGTTNTFSNNIVVPSVPTLGTHAASKDYVDSIVANQRTKQVRVATTANITLSGEQTIDGITTSASRVLVKNQSTQAQNGIYVSAAGAWTRAADMDAAGEVDATFLVVEDGTLGAGTIWVTASEVTTLGTDAIVFTQINSATDIVAGAGLTKTGLTLDVGTASSSRIVVNADSLDLATTAVTPGSYGTSTTIPSITIDAYGRLTAASNTNLQIPISVLDSDPGFTGWTETSGGTVNLEGLNIVSYGGIDADISISGSAIRFGHSSTGASSLNTSAAQIIDELTIDTYGHVTAVTTRNLTLADLGGAGDATIAYLEGSTLTTIDLDTGTSVKDRNGTNIAFTLPTNIDNFEVYRNGVLQNRTGTITTRDYQVNTGTNEITFVVALTSDEIVIFKKR